MRTIEQLVRPNILELIPYSSARDEFNSSEGVFLDANENPYGELNRYPDPYQSALKEKLTELNGISKEHIFIGNGSDEVIDLCYRAFCVPGVDKALTFTPTYGMYDVSAAINDVELIKVPLDNTFQIDTTSLQGYFNDECLKLVFICSPNNPTGNLINDIAYVLQNFDGIVIVDEAYIDFANAASWSAKLDEYPNLIVCQTMSKARGLAAARVGIAYACKQVITILNKIKPPYNVSMLNQKAAINALSENELYTQLVSTILSERERVATAIMKEDVADYIYTSDSNFLLIKFPDAEYWYQELVAIGVITRNRSSVVENCIRITIGSPQENDILLTALRTISNNYQKRQ